MQNLNKDFNVQEFIIDYLLQQSVILNTPNANKILHEHARDLACELDHMKNQASVSIEERRRAAEVVERIHTACDKIDALCISGIWKTPHRNANHP